MDKVIVFLLAAILCVMLLGASMVLSGFMWVAVIGVVLAVILLAPTVIPKVLKSLIWLAALPVLGPRGCWVSICERRANGERVGPFAAGFEIAISFVVSVFLWALYGVPIILWACGAIAAPLPQPKSAGPGGSCPFGYMSSGSFCMPSAGAQDAVPKPPNGTCPWGAGCRRGVFACDPGNKRDGFPNALSYFPDLLCLVCNLGGGRDTARALGKSTGSRPQTR
jgi:hypothetical protein